MTTSNRMRLRLIRVCSSVPDRVNLWYGSMVANRVVDTVRTQRAARVITALEVEFLVGVCNII